MELTEKEEKITRLALNDGALEGERAAAALKLIESLRARGVTVEDMIAETEAATDEYVDDDDDDDEADSDVSEDDESDRTMTPTYVEPPMGLGTWLIMAVMTIFLLPFMPLINRRINERQAAFAAFNARYGTQSEAPPVVTPENSIVPTVTPKSKLPWQRIGLAVLGLYVLAGISLCIDPTALSEGTHKVVSGVCVVAMVVYLIGARYWIQIKGLLAKCWK
jgi:hypothetical protein